MSSEDTEVGSGATDEGWGDELTRTNHEPETDSKSNSDAETESERESKSDTQSTGAQETAQGQTPRDNGTEPPTNAKPESGQSTGTETPLQSSSSGTETSGTAQQTSDSVQSQTISWEEFLGDEEVAAHAQDLRETIAPPELLGEAEIDLRPPMRRFLNSKSNSLDGVEQLGIRVEPETQKAYKELERKVADNFEDDIRGAYLADAVIRVACLHSEEVYAMLGAYGFDFEFK